MIRQLLLLVALYVGLAALVVLCHVMLPNVVRRARHNAEGMPIRSFVVGLVNVSFFGLIAVALLSAEGEEVLQLLGLGIGTIVLGFVAVGLAAVTHLVGERLRPGDPSAVRQLLAGAITLELAALVPGVGWFLLPLLVGLIGCGATIIALLWRRPWAVPATPATTGSTGPSTTAEEGRHVPDVLS